MDRYKETLDKFNQGFDKVTVKAVRENNQEDIKLLESFTRTTSYILNKKPIKYEIEVGDIFEVDFLYNVGAELKNRHYGVAITNSHINNPLVMVVPLKTKKREPHPASDIEIGIIDGLYDNVEAIAIATQIRTIDKMRIFVRGKINDTNLDETKLKLNDQQLNLLKNGLKRLVNIFS